MLVRALALTVLLAQTGALAAQERAASAAWSDSEWLAANAPFEIALTGESSGTLAVMFDKIDISALVRPISPTRLRYHGRGPALPSGQHTITVYDVDANGAWTKIGQFPIKVLSPRGFVSTSFAPAADFTGKGQFAEGHAPVDNAPDRASFQDATTQLAVRAELVRPTTTVRAEAQVAGVTHRPEALRFAIEGENAPKLDLAAYRIDLQRGGTVLSLGHLGVGAMRHLVTGFQSRGVALKAGEGRPLSFELAVMNGTSIVGWSNAFGLSNDRHRVWSATAGIEAFRNAPGRLRIEYGYFQGSTRPETGFNQGGVVTAETSRGNAIRVASTTLDSRIRIDAGYTRSRFESEIDEEVEGGLSVTPITDDTRDAYYADAALEVVRNPRVGATLNLRLEHIEPLFRSLGAPVQADLRTGAAELAFHIGSVSGTLAHVRARDNLAAIESILTTRTERSALTLNVPIATMLGTRWAPILSLQAEALHQFGDGIPIGGDFTIESIPDFASRNIVAGADWQIGSVRAGLRLGTTTQDNRQPGSELRDFVTDTSALAFGWTPNPAFSIGGELGLDRNESVEQQKVDSTLRWAANASWAFYKELAIAGSISNVHAWDDLETRDSANIDGFLELSAGFRLSRVDRRKGRIFVRWTDRRADLVDRTFTLRDSRRSAALTTGLTLSLF